MLYSVLKRIHLQTPHTHPTHRNTSPKCQDAWGFHPTPPIPTLTATPGSGCLLVSTYLRVLPNPLRVSGVFLLGVDQTIILQWIILQQWSTTSFMGQSIVGSPCIRQYVYIRKISD